MISFSFCSNDEFHVVLIYLEELGLGDLYNLYQHKLDIGYGYTAVYMRLTCVSLIEEMRCGFGTKRIVYGENEDGYPLYWNIWW
jgi:hypothetical protein